MYNHIKYTYQQKDQDFPQPPKNNPKAVGKILSKYSRIQSHRYPQSLELNYSQLCQDISQAQSYKPDAITQSLHQLPHLQPINRSQHMEDQEQHINQDVILNHQTNNLWYQLPSHQQPNSQPSNNQQNEIIVLYQQEKQKIIDYDDDQQMQSNKKVGNIVTKQHHFYITHSNSKETLKKLTQQLKMSYAKAQKYSQNHRDNPSEHSKLHQHPQLIDQHDQMHNDKSVQSNYQPYIQQTISKHSTPNQLNQKSIHQHYLHSNNQQKSIVSKEIQPIHQKSFYKSQIHDKSIHHNTNQKSIQVSSRHQFNNQKINQSKSFHQKINPKQSIKSNQKSIHQKSNHPKSIGQKQILTKQFHQNSIQGKSNNRKQLSNLEIIQKSRLSHHQQQQLLNELKQQHNKDESNHYQHLLEQFKKQNPQGQQVVSQHPLKSTIKKSDQVAFITFSLQNYAKIYNILKIIHLTLKSQTIDNQSLVRAVRKYLQLIASGSLDSIDNFDLQLHKKKIVKTALLFERVAVIIVAFSYANQTLKQCHKYILNIISYALSSCLMLLQTLQASDININSHSKESLRKEDRLGMKKNLDTIRNNNDIMSDSITKLSKYESLFYQNLKQIIKNLHKSSLQQTFYNILEYLSFFLCVSQLHQMIPFLAVAPDPYLPPTITHRYTLLIDVVEVCHLSTKQRHTTLRPYTQHFLTQMNSYFEIIVYTSWLPNQIDKMIVAIDVNNCIKHRLYRHHCIYSGAKWLKDIERIGRDPQRVILLDNENIGGSNNKTNCIHIPAWKAELCPVLAMVSIKNINAVNAVAKIKDQIRRNQQQGLKYINFGINFE